MTDRASDDLDLLLRLWEAEQQLDYPRVRELAGALPPERLLEVEEFALLLLYAHVRLGDTVRAESLMRTLEPRFAPPRQDRRRSRFLFAAAEIALEQGRLDESEALVHQALEYVHGAGDATLEVHGMITLGIVAGIRGDFVQALRHHARALASASGGSARWIPYLHQNLGISYRELGFTAEAKRHLEEAARYPRPPYVKACGELERALLLLAVGDGAAAWALARHALATFERIQAPAWVAEARSVLGEIAVNQGWWPQAREELEAALRLIPSDNLLLAAQVHEEIAALEAASGESWTGGEAARRAERLYEQLGAAPRLERMRERLGVPAAR